MQKSNQKSKTYKNYFFTKLIYTSTVVEGIEIRQKEVEDIVKNGAKSKYLQGTPSKHILQAYGQKLALDQIELWAKEDRTFGIPELLELHHITFNKVIPSAGEYRNHHVRLKSSSLIPSFPYAIQVDMRDFEGWVIKRQKEIDKNSKDKIIEFVALVYHKITKIHPFEDGNGRTARLFISLILRKYDLPYIFIPKSNKIRIMRETLQEADRGNFEPLIVFFENLLNTSLKLAKN